VFYEKEHVATMTRHLMTVLSPHDEEQIIVFEMETIAPVCLFHLVPSSMTFASVDGLASGGGLDELTPDAVPIVDADADSIAFGVDALLVPDTAHDDPCIILITLRSVDIQGLDNHQVTNISIVTAGAFTMSQRGPVIIILNQYAGIGRGRTIHSSPQLEAYGNDVNDRSVKVQGGLQRLITLDGYVFPINIVNGLPYVNMRPYTDDEWDSLPHVVWTGDSDWDPTILDHQLADDDQWFDAISDLAAHPYTNAFDEFGDYRNRVLVQNAVVDPAADFVPTFYDALAETPSDDTEDWLDSIVYDANRVCLTVHHADATPSPRLIHTKVPDYEQFRPLFGWLPTATIKRTFEITTQYARMPMSTVLKKRYKSPNPAVNVHRRDEPVATDTVFSDTPAIDGGETAAQIFVGTQSFVTDVEGA
jgi:hypothetical protein